MKHYQTTAQFYKSQDWADCKAQVTQARLKGGALYCEHCGQVIVKSFNPNEKNNAGAIVYHHKVYLNNYNVNDASISINPDNIAILHWQCHNEVHNRFNGVSSQPEKKVYLITGASCSGKTTFVKEHIQANDVVLDIDDIWCMVSGQARYIKPACLKPIVFKVRDEIKELISKGAGMWRNAYIIESLPSPTDRNREAERYKAFNVEVITMAATEQECLERLHTNPSGRDIKAYEGYIKEYFMRYKE